MKFDVAFMKPFETLTNIFAFFKHERSLLLVSRSKNFSYLNCLMHKTLIIKKNFV